MQELVAFVEKVGVPTALCALVVYRIEQRLETMTQAIIELAKQTRCPLIKE